MITFTATGGTWSPSRNPARPQVAPSPQQATAKTAGGVSYGFAPVITEEIIPLAWQGMSSADVATLQTFFIITVKGMTTTFTVSGLFASSFTACFAEPTLTITETAFDRFSVSCSLRRVIA